MQTGLATFTFDVLGINRPVVESIRKTITSLPDWLATNMYCPVGSMAKLRGVLIPSLWCPTAFNSPLLGSIEKMAMEL